MLVVVHLRVERPQVILSHSCCVLVAASLQLVVCHVVGSKRLIGVRVPRLRVLTVEVTGDAARLPRVLRLTVRLVLLVSITEHRVIADSIHLRLVLLPEIEGVRLQMVSHPWAHILLSLVPFHRSHLVLPRELLLHLHIVPIATSRLT